MRHKERHHAQRRRRRCSPLDEVEEDDEEDYLVPSSKLWSTLLIGADKLEIFGSIHVRANNVRLLSCLIDEQLSMEHTDAASQSFSSAASISSSGDSCASKLRHLDAASDATKLAAIIGKSLQQQRRLRLKTNDAVNARFIADMQQQQQQQQRRHHHHHHSHSHKRPHGGYRCSATECKRYRNSHSYASSQPRCCQVATSKSSYGRSKVVALEGSGRRKLATRALPVAFHTDSEPHEYVEEDDDEDEDENKAMHLENDHAVNGAEEEDEAFGEYFGDELDGAFARQRKQHHQSSRTIMDEESRIKSGHINEEAIANLEGKV